MIALLDSSAWLEYFFGSDKGKIIQNVIEKDADIVVSKINIFEIYHKILNELGREKAEQFVSFVLLRSSVDDLDIDTLKLAAEEKKKFKLGMADAIILATVIKHSATFYTGDHDFQNARDVAKVVFL